MSRFNGSGFPKPAKGADSASFVNPLIFRIPLKPAQAIFPSVIVK